jgi:hypothetical protein
MSILSPAAKCADREYDVAISFLVVDENIAASIKGGLSGLTYSLYPHNQEDLIGTNGIETMRAPFLSARRALLHFIALGQNDCNLALYHIATRIPSFIHRASRSLS